ncbi:MAG: Phosphoribosyltransferase [Candidatus Azambacteria bacterium GW2011_GWB2_46_37]|uniref:Phosphoribosyltransferase n=4 Tax=Candidatus Azamiibacteriota TaxID=1752741 RepID=A0A0G1SLF1_9BACT|nr:MAG: Phosphoribosyltransferase [Candidatus Azambacteria bacterium GW2011_GWC1_46_13]KKU36474.1 MAG: Phosphoribosyltransferase [Candidatus Azambacteria bacterium GW2011_GWF2_46_32]KKU39709.1 MAG: Phosphoribosyltransferase [Candidatus Azambacteria bacterium GW2011_GWB2_46_37]KKU42898.1 MAG: Phosphoribosyltransferase [Candidatus Azambacteria bacterium GW2011_GWD2_46_48]HAM95538.1 hypothetical protein [Candidatus Azambacteria bacterium]
MIFLSAKNFFLELLFPSRCLACQKDTSSAPVDEKPLCRDCFEKIPVNSGFFCPNCLNRSFDGNACQSCRGKSPLKRLLIASDYDNEIVKKIILAYKYNFIKDLSRPLRNLIVKYLAQLNFPIDANFTLIAVPLHKKREKYRGFNQSAMLAELLAEHFKLPILNDVLIRGRDTQPQTECVHPKERKENIRGAFECAMPEEVKGKKIILVDDVLTTGATLRECAQVLRRAGAKEIWGLAAAKG